MLVYRRLFFVALIGLALSCTFNPGLNEAKYWPCKSYGNCPEGCECFDGRVCIPQNTDDDPVVCKWCEPGHVDCDGEAGNGCEANLADDPETCGDCLIECPDGWLCEVGACVQGCKTGFVECGGSCVNPQRDPDHCGNCGQACRSSQVCLDGECQGDCGELRDCDGSCTDIKNDPENCGRCGRLCVLPNARPKCELSVCLVDECIHPFGDCDRQVDGCETDLKSSNTNCGSCRNNCGMNSVCLGGDCKCGDYFADCDENPETGCEIRVKTDPMNCGLCGNVCDQPPDDLCEENLLMVHPRLGDCDEYTCWYEPLPTECPFGCESGTCLGDPCEGVSCDQGEICVNGACACGGTGSDCHGEQTCCGTECVYTSVDPEHCGFCFVGCGDNAHCTNSLCYCDDDWGDCNGSLSDGCEINLYESPENCGECGNSCGQDADCISNHCACKQGYGNCDGVWENGCEIDVTTPQNCGTCGSYCYTGEMCCGDFCTDLLQDHLNCGTCGNSCPAGELCCDGGCVDPLDSLTHCGSCFNTCVDGRPCIQGDCGSVGVECDAGNFCDPFQGQRCCNSSAGGMGCNTTNGCTDHMFDCDGPEDCDMGYACCATMETMEATSCVLAGDCPTTFLCNSDLQCEEINPDAGFCCPENIMGIDIFVCMSACP